MCKSWLFASQGLLHVDFWSSKCSGEAAFTGKQCAEQMAPQVKCQMLCELIRKLSRVNQEKTPLHRATPGFF